MVGRAVLTSRIVFPQCDFRVGKCLVEGGVYRETWELAEASPPVPDVPSRLGDSLLFLGFIRVDGPVDHCRCIGGVEVVAGLVVVSIAHTASVASRPETVNRRPPSCYRRGRRAPITAANLEA